MLSSLDFAVPILRFVISEPTKFFFAKRLDVLPAIMLDGRPASFEETRVIRVENSLEPTLYCNDVAPYFLCIAYTKLDQYLFNHVQRGLDRAYFKRGEMCNQECFLRHHLIDSGSR